MVHSYATTGGLLVTYLQTFSHSLHILSYFYGLYLAPDTDIALAALCLVRTDSNVIALALPEIFYRIGFPVLALDRYDFSPLQVFLL